MYKWLRYSGASVSLTINPLHWQWRPWANRWQDEWSGPNLRTYNVGWLFLSARLWLDNGDW